MTPTRTCIPPPASTAARASPPDTELVRYRAACFKLLRERYGQRLAKEGRELAAMRRMFVLHIPFADIEGCWHATLIDPRWETEALTMAIIEDKLVVYRSNPDGYRASMLTKRRVANERDERMKNRGQQRTTFAHPASQRADTEEQQRRREAARVAQHQRKNGV